jgi:hypothetical protein
MIRHGGLFGSLYCTRAMDTWGRCAIARRLSGGWAKVNIASENVGDAQYGPTQKWVVPCFETSSPRSRRWCHDAEEYFRAGLWEFTGCATRGRVKWITRMIIRDRKSSIFLSLFIYDASVKRKRLHPFISGSPWRTMESWLLWDIAKNRLRHPWLHFGHHPAVFLRLYYQFSGFIYVVRIFRSSSVFIHFFSVLPEIDFCQRIHQWPVDE